jgi:hypothetical protein
MSALCAVPTGIFGLALVRLNLASAGAYKHLAAYTTSAVEERICVRIAANRWRQWSELRHHFDCEELPHAEAEVAENEVREYSQILSQGEWTSPAVVEADLFLRDVYDEAIAAIDNSSLRDLLLRHRDQIEGQIHEIRRIHAIDAETEVSG